MIVKKTWERFASDKNGVGYRGSFGSNYLDIYTGWFLFGLIPLYIKRERSRR